MVATVLATTRYERDAKRLLTAQEKAAMQESLAADPEAHPIIPGTDGVRKARCDRQSKGKSSGGARVIYSY